MSACGRCGGTGDVKTEIGAETCPLCAGTCVELVPRTARREDEPIPFVGHQPGEGCGCTLCKHPVPDPPFPGVLESRLLNAVAEERRRRYCEEYGVKAAGWRGPRE